MLGILADVEKEKKNQVTGSYVCDGNVTLYESRSLKLLGYLFVALIGELLAMDRT